MKLLENSNNLQVIIPNKNKGRFRFLEKTDTFYEIFATQQRSFTKNVFLEWQIGYDISHAAAAKSTCLNTPDFIFTNSKGVKKFPYEISEIVYKLTRLSIINIEELLAVCATISSYNDFFSDKITEENENKKTIKNELQFDRYSITLPSYWLKNKDNTDINVAIKRQQYAYGVQPMVYFCIPINSFVNGDEVLGFSSKQKDCPLIYVIDRSNIDVVFNLLKTLAMASENHKRDILAILEVLINNLKKPV